MSEQAQIIDIQKTPNAIIYEYVVGRILTSYYLFDNKFVLHSALVYGYYLHYQMIELN